MNENTRAVLYLRLSKEDIDKINKGDDSESIINQRLLLTDYAIEQGFKIVDIYSDDDYSGLYDDRPEFDRLIRDSKLGKFDVVISKTQSRFTRNMEHMEKYLHHDFPLLNIRFIGVVDNVDTNVKGNKKARQIYGLTNEWYSEDLSENIRSVYKQKMKAGQYLGAFAPYGYEKSIEDKHKFVIDEEACKVVRLIYELALNGYGIKQICHKLEDDDILPPSEYKRRKGLSYANRKSMEFSVKYRLWSASTVKKILSNETYIGTLQQGMYMKASYKDKKVIPVDKRNWVTIENNHEPIIDKETFYKVQNIRKQRRIITKKQTDGKAYLFAGKVKCAKCGSTMIRSGGDFSNEAMTCYLRCQLSNKTRQKECTSHSIMLRNLYNTVLKQIQSITDVDLSGSSEIISNSINIMQENEAKFKDCEGAIRKYKDKISENLNAVKLLYSDRLKGLISDDMFVQLKDNFEAENKSNSDKINELYKELDSLKANINSRSNIQELIDKYKHIDVLTRDIIDDFIDYIEIGDKIDGKREVIIHFNL